MKTFEFNIRPVKGDIIDDPGFHSGFYNGYEIVIIHTREQKSEKLLSL